MDDKNDVKQIEAKFNPTAEQVAFANAYIRHSGNISKACQEIGDKQRNKYYGAKGWRYQEGFEEWLSERAKNEVMKREGKWYLIAEKYAEAGSYQHLSMLMNLAHKFDKLGDQQKVVVIVHDCDRSKDRFKNQGDVQNNPPL